MSDKPLVGQGLIKNSKSKPVILTFIGNYLPGYKAGGILRSIANIVDHLCDDLNFLIVTRDRDLGDDKPYDDIKINQWQPVGNASVYYLPPQSSTVKDITNLISSTKHDILYLNSFFEMFTIKVLLSRKLSSKSFKPIIVAPRGEFAWASLELKYPKKFVFIQLARLVGLYENVTWHASTEFEGLDISRVMKIKNEALHIALDLPVKVITDGAIVMPSQHANYEQDLRIVFLSRIAREKNLDYALKVLNRIKTKVTFDIYGPAEDASYWNKCKMLINKLPKNVDVNYFGSIKPDQASKIFCNYDLFFFPTGGENYGHVIAESLSMGTPVLISDKTPWRHLKNDDLGWDVPLDNEESFVTIIEELAKSSVDERVMRRNLIKDKIIKRLNNQAVLDANRKLFTKHMQP